MAIAVIGLHHRGTPLELLERLTVDAPDLPKVLAAAARRDRVREAVVVSTCNRIEIYAEVERFHDAFSGLCSVLADHADLPVAAIADHLAVDFEDTAARHLFTVAAGLDSVVIGETEILGQLKQAWKAARAENVLGPQLDALFRHAFEVGKRARTETGIARSIASVSTAAIALADRRADGLAGQRVLVLGAGTMGTQMAEALTGTGVAEILIANRTSSRAEDLAAQVGGTVVAPDALAGALGSVDLVLASTAAPEALLGLGTMRDVMAARQGRPLSIIDIALPRDVDPRVADLDGVDLFDMDDLRTLGDEARRRRHAEIAAVDEIIEDEFVRFRARRTARLVAPMVASLHTRGEAIRRSELARFTGRLDGLTDRQRDAVEALTRGIVAKMLHTPSVRLGDLAGTPRGDRIVDALEDLYDLAGDEGIWDPTET